MKTNIHLLSYHVQFFLERGMFQEKNGGKNQNTHFMFSNFFFRTSCCLLDNVEKYFITGQATDDNMVHVSLMLNT